MSAPASVPQPDEAAETVPLRPALAAPALSLEDAAEIRGNGFYLSPLPLAAGEAA